MDPFLYCQLYLFISQFAPQFFEKEQHAANQALTHVAVGSPVEHTSFLPSTFEFSGAAEYDYVYGISQERPSSFRRDLNHAFGDLLTVLIQHYRVFLILILILALIVLYACLHKVIAWPLLCIKTLIWGNTPAPVPVPVPAPAVPDVLMRQLSALPNQFKSLGKNFGDLVRTTRDDVNHLQDFNEQTSERLDSVEEDKVDGTQAVVIFQALSSDMDTRVMGAEVQLEDLSLQGAITSSKVDQLEVQAEKVEKQLENTTQGHVWPQIWKLWDRLDSLQKKVDELTEKVQSLQSSPQGNGDGMSQDLKDELESIKERLAALDPRVKGTEDQLELIGAGSTSTEIWKALPTLQPAFNDLWKAVKALDKKLDGFAALKGKQQELEAALVDHQRQLETLKKNAALPKADITKADVVRMIQESETRSRSYADEIRRQMSEGLEAVKGDNISLRQDLRERFAHDDTRFDNLDGRLTNVSFEKSSRGQRVTNLENEVLRLNRALEDATRTSRERICPCHNCVQKPPGRADLLLAAAPVVEGPFTQTPAAPFVPLPPSPAALPEVAMVEPAPQAPAIEDVREVREDSSIGNEPAESSSSKAPTAAQTRPRDARRAVPRSQRGRHAPRADRSDAVAAPAAQFQAPEGYAPAVFPAPTGTPAFVAPSGILSFPPPTALPLPPAAVEAAASAAIGGFLTSGGAFTRGAFPAPTTPLAPFGSSAPPPFSAPPAPSAPAAAPHTAAIPPSTGGDVLSAVQIQALQGYNSSQPAQQHAPTQPILNSTSNFRAVPLNAGASYLDSQPWSASPTMPQMNQLQTADPTSIALQQLDEDRDAEGEPDYEMMDHQDGPHELDHAQAPKSPDWAAAGQEPVADDPDEFDEPGNPSQPSTSAPPTQPTILLPRATVIDLTGDDIESHFPEGAPVTQAGPSDTIIGESEQVPLDPQPATQEGTNSSFTFSFGPTVQFPAAEVAQPVQQSNAPQTITSFAPETEGEKEPADFTQQNPLLLSQEQQVQRFGQGVYALGNHTPFQVNQQMGQFDLYADDDMMGIDQPGQQAGRFDSPMTEDMSAFNSGPPPQQPTSQTHPGFGGIPGLYTSSWTPPHMLQQNVQPSPVGGVQGQGFSPQTPSQPQQTAQPDPSEQAPETYIVNGMVFTRHPPPLPANVKEDIDRMAALDWNDLDLLGVPSAASTNQTGDPEVGSAIEEQLLNHIALNQQNWYHPSAPLAASTDDTQGTVMGGQLDYTGAQDQPQSSLAQDQAQASQDVDDVDAGWAFIDNQMPGGSVSAAVDQMHNAAMEGLAQIAGAQNQPQNTTAQTQDTGMADQFGNAEAQSRFRSAMAQYHAGNQP